ncbi:pyridoxine/pyridoxal/pyridoxamine kinase [Phaeovibrio sulfidiphilus]|uniref:pyridoxal kinase n=1 Tax=Phaeovibrio sulfidiphilus TaxID=1220600 RepID=A0A8J6YXS4_9PROT|nr:pyridoxine/pyridoxal/pyridoxamine kinase [Phaeovibrio sulfidiphilus]MBE1236548.1 pyridoxine/pyridoxal/pyridoxamine kinase [Phaeovibrio sulfidiphilus]
MISNGSVRVPGALQYDVVSVQSLVVYGRVGNSVAVPALEALGLTVASVPSVVLSNTPDYPTLHGGALPLDWFTGYLEDLDRRGALESLRAVLTGYLGTAEQAGALAAWIRALQARRPNLRVVVDPVLGDSEDGLYVDPDLAAAVRRDLVPLADGLTPNGFELGYLTGMPVDDIDSVLAAARTLLTGRTRWVAVTSAASDPAEPPDAEGSREIRVVLVTRTGSWLLSHPRLEDVPKGTGDLFCATLTGHWLGGADVSEAATRACQHLVRVLRLTQQANCGELLAAPMGFCDGDMGDIIVRQIGVRPLASPFMFRPEMS